MSTLWFIPVYILCITGGQEFCIPVTLDPVSSYTKCTSALEILDDRAVREFLGREMYVHTRECRPTIKT